MGALRAYRSAVYAALLCASMVGIEMLGHPSAYAKFQAVEPSFSVSLPLVADNQLLGAIPVESSMTALVRIPPAALADALADRINSEADAALRALGASLVEVSVIRALGFDLRLNSQTLAIEVDVPAGLRAARTRSLARSVSDAYRDAVQAEGTALGVTGALLVTDTLTDHDGLAAEFNFDGFANRGGASGISLDWGGRLRMRPSGDTDFQRDRILAFTDRVETARRYAAGEISTDLFRDIGLLDVVGVSTEQSFQTLQPTRNVRPTGARSLVLDRRSTVEIFVNGALVNRFVAEAGPLDLQDIPLANISNDVTIVVEDSLGRREVDSFALSADVSLLAAGVSEWAWSAGFARNQSEDGLSYDLETPVAGARFTRGVRSGLTLGAATAITPDFSALSGAVAIAGFAGVSQLDLTTSQSQRAGNGFAAGFNYSGGPYLQDSRPMTVNLRINYQSKDFSTLNDLSSLSSSRWSVGADARLSISDRTALTLSSIMQDDHLGEVRSTTVSVGISRRVGDIIVSGAARWSDFGNDRSEAGVFITLSRRLGARQQMTASYDSLSHTGRLDWRRSRLPGSPNLAAQASAVQTGETTDFNGTLSGETSRGTAQFDASYRPGSNGLGDRATVGLRLQSGIAMVDGRWGMGRDPGRGFAMIDRHASLNDAEILVSIGSGERPIARSDRFGPAVVPLAAPYRPQELRIGARNLEPGYSIGAGAYTVLPGALTGVRLQIGNAAFRTAVATLIGFEGEPVALRFGQLTNLESGEEASFFTNRAGRAAFNALAPGSYEARLQSGTVFRFEIEADAPAYVNIGTIQAELPNG